MIQAEGFRDESENLEQSNAIVIGVSPDPIDKLQEFRANLNIPFLLLSDPDSEVAKMYGAWGEKESGGKTVTGVLRSHFIIDADGTIADAQIRVTPQESVERAAAKLREMSQAASPAASPAASSRRQVDKTGG